MKVIYILTIIATILFIPLKVHANIIFNANEKKAYCEINLYRRIKIKSLYITFNKKDLIIHLSDKKAMIYPYKNFIQNKSFLKFYKDVNIKELYVLAEIGKINDISTLLTSTFIYNFIFNTILSTLKEIKPFIRAKSVTNITNQDNLFNLFANVQVYVNIIVIMINLIKIFMEKIINAKRKKYGKKQVY